MPWREHGICEEFFTVRVYEIWPAPALPGMTVNTAARSVPAHGLALATDAVVVTVVVVVSVSVLVTVTVFVPPPRPQPAAVSARVERTSPVAARRPATPALR